MASVSWSCHDHASWGTVNVYHLIHFVTLKNENLNVSGKKRLSAQAKSVVQFKIDLCYNELVGKRPYPLKSCGLYLGKASQDLLVEQAYFVLKCRGDRLPKYLW